MANTAATLACNLILNSKGFDAGTKEGRENIKKFKKDMADFEKGVGKVKGSILSVASNILKMAGPIGAVTSGVALFGEALKTNQTLSDEWGRTTSALSSSLDSLFLAMSSGSFDGFIKGLNGVIEKSRALYDSLDALATFEIYKTGDMAELEAERSAYELVLKNAKAVDEKGNRRYTEADIRKAEKGIEEVDQKIMNYLWKQKSLVEQSKTDFVNLVMEQTGASKELVVQMLTEYDTAEKVQARMKKLKDTYQTVPEITTVSSTTGTTFTTSAVWSDKDAKQEYKTLKKLTDLASDGDKYLGKYNAKRKESADITREINNRMMQEERLKSRANRSLLEGTGGTSSTYSSSLSKLKTYTLEEMDELNKEIQSRELQLSITTDPAAIKEIQAELDALTENRNVNVSVMAAEERKRWYEDYSYIGKNISLDKNMEIVTRETLDNMKIDPLEIPIQIDTERAVENIKAETAEIAKLFDLETIGKWGSAVSSVGDLVDGVGEAIGGTSGQMVSWIGQTTAAVGELITKYFATAIAAQGSLPFPENIAAIAATAGVILTAITSFPKFETGGIVPGTSFSGDKVPVLANSGEMILNQKQQYRLFNILANSTTILGGTDGTVDFRIRGNDLYGVLTNYKDKHSIL